MFNRFKDGIFKDASTITPQNVNLDIEVVLNLSEISSGGNVIIEFFN